METSTVIPASGALTTRYALLVIGASPTKDARPDWEVNKIIDAIASARGVMATAPMVGSWGPDDVHAVQATSGDRVPKLLGLHRPVVLHMSCHHEKATPDVATPHPATCQGYFHLETGVDCRVEHYSDEQLVKTIRLTYVGETRRPLVLVVFSACDTSELANRIVQEKLAHAAIGAVGKVPDELATVFSSELYSWLACGWEIGAAYGLAKEAVVNYLKRCDSDHDPQHVEADARAAAERFQLFATSPAIRVLVARDVPIAGTAIACVPAVESMRSNPEVRRQLHVKLGSLLINYALALRHQEPQPFGLGISGLQDVPSADVSLWATEASEGSGAQMLISSGPAAMQVLLAPRKAGNPGSRIIIAKVRPAHRKTRWSLSNIYRFCRQAKARLGCCQ